MITLQGQVDTTSSCRIPQVRKEARVGGCSGAISDLPFLFLDLPKQIQHPSNPQIPHSFMKFFIDTANLSEIQEAQELGVLDGVTTNPSLMAKEGITGEENIIQHYKDICDIVDDNVSAEVIATDYEGIMSEGRALAKLDDKIVVKVPMIKEGVKAIKSLNAEGIRVNCTLVFSAGQAILAAKAGAAYVSPFIGRLDDVATDGVELIGQIVNIYDNYGYETEVLAASIRHVMHLIQCAELGADVATCPFKVIVGLLNHPLTDKGLAQFLADHEKAKKVPVA